MKLHYWSALLAASLFLAPLSLGAEPRTKSKTGNPAAAIEPLIDNQAVVVAHADLTQPDLATLLGKAAKFLPADCEVSKLASGVETFAAQFSQAGGRDLYLIVSLDDLPNQSPYWLAPLSDDADDERLRSLFESLPCEVRQRVGDVLFAGSRQALARLEHSPASRPEIARAFGAVEGAAAQLLILPTGDARRVIEELPPTLPAGGRGGGPTTRSGGALWLSLGVSTAPHVSARLVIQSQNHGAAAALGSHWGHWYQMLAQRAGGEMAAKLTGVQGRLTPDVRGDRLVLELDAQRLEQVGAVLQPSVSYLEERIRFEQSTNNLKQIGLAMHGYADTHKHLPAAAIYDDDGRPLLSWRVAVLPHLGEEALYREFHLDEPWDSEHNARLIERMPQFYRSPGQRELAAGRTTYLAPVGEKTLFEGREGKRFQEITDGTSKTIMAVEAGKAQAVVWTKPDDWPVAADAPAAGLSSPYGNRILVLLCDGAVLALKWPLEAEAVRALASCNGGEVVDLSKLMWRGK